MSFYLAPIESIGYTRVPRYLKSRSIEDGLDCAWSFKDFGAGSPIGLLSTDIQLAFPDYFELPSTGAWTVKGRSDLDAFLKAAGVEDGGWIVNGEHWREGLHRVSGIALAMQSAVDDPFSDLQKQDPSKWLEKDIHFGQDRLTAYKPKPEPQRESLVSAVLASDSFRASKQSGSKWRAILTRIPLALLILILGALPVTDTFTTGTNQALTAYSANWSNNIGAFAVIAASDNINPNNAGNECGSFHNVETFNNDQYSQIVIASRTTGSTIGAGSRHAAAGTATYGGWYTSQTAAYLFKMVTGTWTQLGSNGTAGAVNDIFRLEAEGTTWRPKVNGSVPGTPGAQTDSSIASGKGGVTGFNNSTSMLGDNFEAGNLTAAAGILRQMMNHEGA